MLPRVAIPLLNLVPGAMGGSETYARALVNGLDPRRVAATAYVPRGAAGFSRGIPEVVVPEVTGGPSTRERLAVAARATISGPRIARRFADADVVHYPFSALLPRPVRGQRRIITIHDLQHRDLPENFSRAERAYRALAYERPAQEADLVITVSEYARQGVIEHLGVDPDRVRAIHLGVDLSAFSPGDEPRENVLYYPARPYPHKNHRALVDAVALLREEDPTLRLVLSGEGLDRLGDLPAWVERRGLVSFDEVRRLYRTSRLMVFPSLYEGFGLPPLEAMASGTPVAASNAASIPEVVGDAAELFDPTTPTSIAEGIRRALARTDDLVARGFRQTADTGWDRCLRAHEDAYAEVAAPIA